MNSFGALFEYEIWLIKNWQILYLCQIKRCQNSKLGFWSENDLTILNSAVYNGTLAIMTNINLSVQTGMTNVNLADFFVYYEL